MKSLPKSPREFYASQNKQQLIVFLLNQDYRIQLFQEKLKMLTGCGSYGDCDGMDGSCIDCYYDNPVLHNTCREFQDEIFKKRNEEVENE